MSKAELDTNLRNTVKDSKDIVNRGEEFVKEKTGFSLDPLKMITRCNGHSFTPIIITSIERCDKGAGC